MERIKPEKLPYTTPVLERFGTLEDITKQQNKNYGPSDEFTFQGVPIMDIG